MAISVHKDDHNHDRYHPHLYHYFKFNSLVLVIRWRSSVKSRSQQEIKAIYLIILRMMCAVIIIIIIIVIPNNGPKEVAVCDEVSVG